MKGLKRESLYILLGKAQTSEAHVAELAMTEQTKRSEDQKGLEVLAKKGCFKDNKVFDLKFCKDCAIGKTHKVSFGLAQHVTKGNLDCVHSDLWGHYKKTEMLPLTV